MSNKDISPHLNHSSGQNIEDVLRDMAVDVSDQQMEINKAKETSKMLRLSSVFVRKTKSAYCEKCVYEKDVYYFWFVCYFLQG